MKGVRIWMVTVTAYAGLSANVLQGQGTLEYPQTATVDQVDDYHGTKVPDPYRWLEDDVRESEEVAAWVEAENKVTFAYLEAIPQREPIRKRLTELWDFEKYGSPFKAAGATTTSTTRAAEPVRALRDGLARRASRAC